MIKGIAWDLIGKHAGLLDSGYYVRLPGGWAQYEEAIMTKGENIVLVRINGGLTDKEPPKVTERWVQFDQPIELLYPGEVT